MTETETAAPTAPATRQTVVTPTPTAPEGAPPRESFDRAYVEELRRENAAQRVKGKRADDLASKLVTAYAAGTARLADATDLPYDEALCDEHGVPHAGKVHDAVEALLLAKPHLASRRPVGDVGQGARLDTPPPVSLSGLLRAGAGS